MRKHNQRKGFTLIELLIVIAIIAVLATVVILTLNPAELLRQSRDSNRVSDMATLKSALALYLADLAVPSLGTSSWCYVSVTSVTGNWEITNAGVPTSTSANGCPLWFTTNTLANVSTSALRGTGGVNSGWIPVNFNAISSGSPLGQLPVDPVNTVGGSSCAVTNLSSCGLFYSYISTSTVYKVATKLESLKYAYTTNNTSTSPEYNDGGNNIYMYEQGTNMAL